MSAIDDFLKYASALLILAATALQVIAVATPGWSGTKEQHYGLWHVCGSTLNHPEPDCRRMGNLNEVTGLGGESLDGVRTMQGMTILAFIIATVAWIFYIRQGGRLVRLLMSVSAIIGGVCALIGIIIFSAENSQLYYSFIICVVAAASGVMAAGMGLIMRHIPENEKHIQL